MDVTDDAKAVGDDKTLEKGETDKHVHPVEVVIPSGTGMEGERVDEERNDKHFGEMLREMGDGEEETGETTAGENSAQQIVSAMDRPLQERELGDGQEEEETDPPSQGARHPGDLKDDKGSNTDSQSDSVPGVQPEVIPAVEDNQDTGGPNQVETTDDEKLEEVKKASLSFERLVDGREIQNQEKGHHEISSAAAVLASPDKTGSVPPGKLDRNQTEVTALPVQGSRKQVATVSHDHRIGRPNRMPFFRSAQTHVQCIQAPRAVRDSDPGKHVSRFPPRLLRLATVTMAPKLKSAVPVPSLYYEEPRRPRKVITWDQANNARPPLRIDMEGPTPWSYSPRNKPLYETNAPSWTFGSRCSPERDGGSRTSWAKTWFQTPHVWHNKVDFTSDSRWPSPNAYIKSSLLGPRQRTMPEYPAFTIGRKGTFSYVKPGAEKEPSPNEYDRTPCDRLLYRSTPSFTHQFRREGTILWSPGEDTPGPGAYSPTASCNHPHQPAFSIMGIRREKSHVLGPYSTF